MNVVVLTVPWGCRFALWGFPLAQGALHGLTPWLSVPCGSMGAGSLVGMQGRAPVRPLRAQLRGACESADVVPWAFIV
jgi:hypothetical protein